MRFDKPAAFQIQSIAYKSHYENVPFEIPESWCWCKLSDVCNFESGYAFSSDDYKDKGTPLVRISNIQDGLVSLDNCVYIEGDIDKRFIINNGDLLIAMSGATTGKMGVYQYDCPALLNQRVGNIKVNTSLLLQKYRDYFMQSQGDLILKLSYGGAQPNVSAKIISDLFIPIPSLNEQEKIVAEIEKWFGFIDEIENGKIELESHIKKTKSKILDLAISGKLVPQDPNDEPAIELLKRINPDFEPCDNSHYENLPQGWTIVGLHSVAEIITGSTPSKLNAEYYNGDVPFYKPNDLDQGRHVRCASEYLSQQGKSISRSIPCNSIAVCCIGSIGKCGFIEKEGVTNQQINTIVPNDAIFPLYMYYFCNSSTFIDELKSLSSAVTISIVNKSKLSTIQIPLPPIAEQKRIISVIEKLYSHLDMITAEL